MGEVVYFCLPGGWSVECLNVASEQLREVAMRLTIIVFAVLAMASLASADTYAGRIALARADGDITIDEAALYYVYSVVDESRLPGWVTEDAVADPCGTPAIHEAELMLDEVSAPVREEILGLLARPTLSGPEQTYDTSDGNFKIHWTNSGADATNLAWVQFYGEGFMWSWEHECGDMNWDEPPSDLGLGGDERYDVYVMALSGGTLGYTSSSGEPGDPTTPENDSASHIVMSNNESWGQQTMSGTCSHEFQHALQMGYDKTEPSWFMENCATWMENECWDDYNTYADYLHTGDNCLRKPWYDIRSGPMYHYGATPFPMYIQLSHMGQVSVRLVWEYCASVTTPNMWGALESTAEYYGSTIEEWLAEYAYWRWFTGNRADGEHYDYDECSLWTPGAYIFGYHNIDELPASIDQGYYPPDTYGHHWVTVEVDNYQGWITFDFDGRDNMSFQLGVIRTKDNGDDDYCWWPVTGASQQMSLGVCTSGWDDVIFVVQGMTDTSFDLNYEADITYATGVEGEEVDPAIDLVPESNPMAAGGTITMTIPETGWTTLHVYDITGRVVDTLHRGQLDAGTHSVVWEADRISPGTYFLQLNTRGGIATRRLVLN